MNKNNAIRGRNQNASREIGLPIVEIEKMVSKNSKSSGASTTFLTDSNSDYDVKVYIRSVFLDLRNHWKSSSILARNFRGLQRSLSWNWSIQEHIQIESELTSISTLYICIGILCKWKVQYNRLYPIILIIFQISFNELLWMAKNWVLPSRVSCNIFQTSSWLVKIQFLLHMRVQSTILRREDYVVSHNFITIKIS